MAGHIIPMLGGFMAFYPTQLPSSISILMKPNQLGDIIKRCHQNNNPRQSFVLDFSENRDKSIRINVRFGHIDKMVIDYQNDKYGASINAPYVRDKSDLKSLSHP